MKKLNSYFILGAVSLLMLPCIALAGILTPDLKEAVDAAGPGEKIPVIVTLADSVNLKDVHGRSRAEILRTLHQKADATQGPLLAALANKNIRNVKRFWIFNGAAFEAPAPVISHLENLPGIASIRLDATVNAPEPFPAAAAIPEWNISSVRAPELWSLGVTGSGIVFANMDTGVDPNHQDLTGKWRGGTNSWFDPYSSSVDPYDSDGHGTQTMGIMVGGANSGTAIGMAPDAQWIAAKIFNQSGAKTSIIHQGFQWLLDPDNNPATDDAPDVVNNSWGFETAAGICITEFEPDIAALKAMNIAVVFSAGNSGPYAGTSVSPANNANGFGVGAVDNTLSVADFSSRGPSACDGSSFPEVVAPGVNIKTADLTYSGTFPAEYLYVDGTSFASPHVAGAMGLLMSAYPLHSVDQIESALKASAVDINPAGPDNESGSGLLDVKAAFDLLGQISPPPQPQCTDADLDDFFAESGCGTPVDCDDNADTTYPGACDIKGDGIDQDCDGKDRLKGKPCPDSGVTTEPPPPDGGGDTSGVEGKGKTCSDGIDNDGDQAIDCGDPDCYGNRSCR